MKHQAIHQAMSLRYLIGGKIIEVATFTREDEEPVLTLAVLTQGGAGVDVRVLAERRTRGREVAPGWLETFPVRGHRILDKSVIDDVLETVKEAAYNALDTGYTIAHAIAAGRDRYNELMEGTDGP